MLKTIFSSSLIERFALAESWGKNKEEALLALDKITVLVREEMINELMNKQTDNKNKYKDFLRFVRKIKIYIEANVNPRFALENLFLSC